METFCIYTAYGLSRNKIGYNSKKTIWAKGVIEGAPCDYLAPFLVGFHDVDHLSSKEAERIKEACLGALKDRLLERAQIMQSKLDEEMAKAKEESHDSAGDASAAARIMVWEKRLEHHEQLSLEKYALLQEKLNADIRLQDAMD